MKKRVIAFYAALTSITLILSSCGRILAPVETATELEAPTESSTPSAETHAATDMTTAETEPPEPDAPILSATVIDNSTGEQIDGVGLELDGRSVVLKMPLHLSDSVIRNVSVAFTLDDGTETPSMVLDLKKENVFKLTDSISCVLNSKRESFGLPVLEINTDGGAPILDKENYVHGTLTVDGREYPMGIRGRGNSSWRMFPKKSYRIKLDRGAPLLGMTQNRDWVLTSNYPDKTLIRNCVASDMAKSLSSLAYTPTHNLVNFYLNGEYIGVYTFGDRIEDGKGRLELGEPVKDSSGKVSDVGFLMEMGWDFDGENIYNKDYFDTKYALRIYVKEPEVDYPNSPEFTIAKRYIEQTEAAIVYNSGWENYIDVDSFVDWFIINELTFNTESSYYRSCYFWRPVGGKLQMGPIWDFDMAFGNHYADLWGYNGWCTTESQYIYIYKNWMNFLIQYPTFTEKLKTRWNEVKEDLLNTALGAVDKYSSSLDGSQQANFTRWNIMTSQVGEASVNGYIYDTYEKQVQYLRDFLNTRWSYMDERINSGDISGPVRPEPAETDNDGNPIESDITEE